MFSADALAAGAGVRTMWVSCKRCEEGGMGRCGPPRARDKHILLIDRAVIERLERGARLSA